MKKSYNYEKRIHYEKRYLTKSKVCTTAFLSEDEFYFIKAHTDEFLTFIKALNLKGLNHNDQFRQVFTYFEASMPDFIDDFLGMLYDGHLLNTNSKFFDKTAFFKQLENNLYTKKNNRLTPDEYKSNIENNFPDYVIWRINSISSYLFINNDWLNELEYFFYRFKTKPETKIDMKELEHSIEIGNDFNCYFTPWINYEVFKKVWYIYITYDNIYN